MVRCVEKKLHHRFQPIMDIDFIYQEIVKRLKLVRKYHSHFPKDPVNENTLHSHHETILGVMIYIVTTFENVNIIVSY